MKWLAISVMPWTLVEVFKSLDLNKFSKFLINGEMTLQIVCRIRVSFHWATHNKLLPNGKPLKWPLLQQWLSIP